MADTEKAQITIQSNIKQAIADDITKYALFQGGTNVTSDVLQCYDPLKTGYGRIFMVKRPIFLMDTIGDKLDRFKHIIEYGNTSIKGISDIQVETESIKGGYVGKSFEIPTYASDNTNSLSITVYEFSGSPIREVLHSWINGSTDLLTGLTHYNGADAKYQRIQANQTAEFIYVSTDSTGENVEYACLFANCFPKGINNDVFNYTSGEHNLVETEIEFTATKYESLQINEVAKKLLTKYKILTNSLNFYSGYEYEGDEAEKTLGGDAGILYNYKTGQLDRISADNPEEDTTGNVITDEYAKAEKTPIDPNSDEG